MSCTVLTLVLTLSHLAVYNTNGDRDKIEKQRQTINSSDKATGTITTVTTATKQGRVFFTHEWQLPVKLM